METTEGTVVHIQPDVDGVAIEVSVDGFTSLTLSGTEALGLVDDALRAVREVAPNRLDEWILAQVAVGR